SLTKLARNFFLSFSHISKPIIYLIYSKPAFLCKDHFFMLHWVWVVKILHKPSLQNHLSFLRHFWHISLGLPDLKASLIQCRPRSLYPLRVNIGFYILLSSLHSS